MFYSGSGKTFTCHSVTNVCLTYNKTITKYSWETITVKNLNTKMLVMEEVIT
jgi:hypothetical protein